MAMRENPSDTEVKHLRSVKWGDDTVIFRPENGMEVLGLNKKKIISKKKKFLVYRY